MTSSDGDDSPWWRSNLLEVPNPTPFTPRFDEATTAWDECLGRWSAGITEEAMASGFPEKLKAESVLQEVLCDVIAARLLVLDSFRVFYATDSDILSSYDIETSTLPSIEEMESLLRAGDSLVPLTTRIADMRRLAALCRKRGYQSADDVDDAIERYIKAENRVRDGGSPHHRPRWADMSYIAGEYPRVQYMNSRNPAASFQIASTMSMLPQPPGHDDILCIAGKSAPQYGTAAFTARVAAVREEWRAHLEPLCHDLLAELRATNRGERLTAQVDLLNCMAMIWMTKGKMFGLFHSARMAIGAFEDPKEAGLEEMPREAEVVMFEQSCHAIYSFREREYPICCILIRGAARRMLDIREQDALRLVSERLREYDEDGEWKFKWERNSATASKIPK